MYCRPFLIRFIERHRGAAGWLLFTFVPSAATALVFALVFFVAPLLHLGNVETSGPAADDAMPAISSASPVTAIEIHGPVTLASRAGLDLDEVW